MRWKAFLGLLDKVMGCQKLSKLSTNNFGHSRYSSRFHQTKTKHDTHHQNNAAISTRKRRAAAQ